MIGVNSVQSTSKVRVRAAGSVKYPREDPVWRQTHRSKSMKISNSTEFSAKDAKVNGSRENAYVALFARFLSIAEGNAASLSVSSADPGF